MFHILDSIAAGPIAKMLHACRAIAPWIAGFEKPLRQTFDDPARSADPSGFSLRGEWADGLVDGLAAARRQAALLRWQEGPGAWQDWADAVRLLRAEFAFDPRADRFLNWLAYADFSHQAFGLSADFDGYDFPSGASFSGAEFLADAWFSAARFGGPADFHGARFAHDVFFEQCWFKAHADFDGANVAGSARFSAMIALASFSACKTVFENDVWMRSSQLFGPLNFVQSRIVGEAGFGNCNFQDIDFSHVDFRDNAGFEDSVFSGDANFEHAAFGGNARFERAHFAVQPRFKAARFFRACHFDDALIPVVASPVANCYEEIERRLLK